MAKVIGIFGKPGTGKTYSVRNLDPEHTFYIDCDGKGLNWRGWKNSYNKDAGNYIRTNFHTTVKKWMVYLNGQKFAADGKTIVQNDGSDKWKRFDTVVIDTMNGIMIQEEFLAMKGKNYDKWLDLATNVWDLLEYALTMRDDLNVIFVFHSETVSDDFGYSETRVLTSGKKLRKLIPESKFNTLLMSDFLEGGKYVFWCRKVGCTCRVPGDAFNGAEYIDNDVLAVIKELDEF